MDEEKGKRERGAREHERPGRAMVAFAGKRDSGEGVEIWDKDAEMWEEMLLLFRIRAN